MLVSTEIWNPTNQARGDTEHKHWYAPPNLILRLLTTSYGTCRGRILGVQDFVKIIPEKNPDSGKCSNFFVFESYDLIFGEIHSHVWNVQFRGWSHQFELSGLMKTTVMIGSTYQYNILSSVLTSLAGSRETWYDWVASDIDYQTWCRINI